MKHLPGALTVLIAAVIGGCAHGPDAGGWVGTEIQIPEPIEISAGSARAWFQGGRQSPRAPTVEVPMAAGSIPSIQTDVRL